MNHKSSPVTPNDSDDTQKKARLHSNNFTDDADMDEKTKMAILEQYHMGGATSPRAMVPTIHGEAFMFLKNIIRKIRRSGK